MTPHIRFLARAIRENGFPWVARRAIYEAEVRAGAHRLRFRPRAWDARELRRWISSPQLAEADRFFEEWKKSKARYFFEPEDRDATGKVLREVMGPAGVQELTAEAEGIAEGKFSYFFKHEGQLDFPPNWHRNPFTGGEAKPGNHWTRLPMYSEDYGDMKFVWEPGRFASAYVLARAYWVTGREEFPETFWRLVESWRESNPPNSSAHWKCGQEAGLRLMAWYFALHAFLDARATTPSRVAMLVEMAAAQVDRIERDHIYAHLQKNNHAMSEGAALYVTGLLFPQLSRAETWRSKGLQILEEEGVALIKPEGTFRQKSHNYHRLMLHVYLYAGRLAELNEAGFSRELMERLRHASEYLYQVQDEQSGMVPNYGANDGALVLPLNGCDYRDYRPVCAAAHFFFNRKRIHPRGCWDEDLVWLFGKQSLMGEEASPERVDIEKRAGGIYTFRGKETWAFTHCESFEERPGNADALHFDLWWRGLNLTLDPGSFLYFTGPPWKGGFDRTRSHCTVSVDDRDQMETGPRFMMTNWHSAKINATKESPERRFKYWEGEHDGYARLADPVIHRRGILRIDDSWMIVDDLLGRGAHDIALHWLLPDYPYRREGELLTLLTPQGDYSVRTSLFRPSDGSAGIDLIRGSEGSAPRGWVSHYYGHREPAISLLRTYSGQLPCRFVTLFSPVRDPVFELEEEGVVLESAAQLLRATLNPPGESPMMASFPEPVQQAV